MKAERPICRIILNIIQMKRLILFLLVYTTIAAQAAPVCSKGNKHKAHAKTTVADPAENDYDVQYVKMDLRATNLSTAIEGHVTTVAKVIVPAMPNYVFELSAQLTIDSVFIDGQVVSVTSNDSIRTVSGIALTMGTQFTADVYYHGQPVGGNNFFTNGLLHAADAGTGTNVTHTVSAAVHSRDWWPCKQSLTDKIDSADIWVTVPAGNKVAGNGILKDSIDLGNGEKRFEWSMRYPADYYLLSFAVAPYDEYNYHMHFDNSTDSMLIQNFIYPSPSVLQNSQNELDSIALMINHFSDIFGRYPFDGEKFGICQTPLGGGMENQTMVSLGSLDAELIAHELSHQWWGDNVTCATLKDMWMNEGWATYCEQLFVEKFRGQAAAFSKRTGIFNTILTNSPTGSVYVDDTTNEGRIYDGLLTYYKGAAVAHMLRYMMDDDAAFYNLLRAYHQQYKYSTTTTADFRTLAETFTSQDLDTFFTQWVYGEGFPTYKAKWYQRTDGTVLLRLDQTTSKPSSVACFKMPIEITFKSAVGDTTIRLLNDQNSQDYSFVWSNTMTGLTIDPQNDILNKTGTIAKDSTLSVSALSLSWSLHIYPNPASTGWSITDLPSGLTLTLRNTLGQQVWQGVSTNDTVHISAQSLAPATYILTVSTAGRRSVSYHLVKE